MLKALVFKNMKIHLSFLIVISALLSGCSSNYDWERWEYSLVKQINSGVLRASLIPTRYGARKLSSTGPYRLVLHQQKLCGEEYLELEKIEVLKGTEKTTIPTGNPKDILLKKYGEKCLLTFASEVLIALDYEGGENATIVVDFISNRKSRVVQEATFKFKPEFSKGKTRIPWLTT